MSVKIREFPGIQEKHGVHCVAFSPAEPVDPPILLLHEALGSVGIWKNFPAELATATGRTVIVYDRLGHGKSRPIPGKRSLDYLNTYTDFVPVLLKELSASMEVSKPIVFGHSDGATIALLAGVREYDFSAIIVEAPHSEVDDQTRRGVTAARAKSFRQPLCEKLYKYHGPEKTEWLYDGWVDIWLHPDFRGCCMLDSLHKIKVPLLAIQGAEDEYGLPTQLEHLKNNCSGVVETHLLADCRHNPHVEKKAEVLRITAEFIKKHV